MGEWMGERQVVDAWVSGWMVSKWWIHGQMHETARPMQTPHLLRALAEPHQAPEQTRRPRRTSWTFPITIPAAPVPACALVAVLTCTPEAAVRLHVGAEHLVAHTDVQTSHRAPHRLGIMMPRQPERQEVFVADLTCFPLKQVCNG